MKIDDGTFHLYRAVTLTLNKTPPPKPWKYCTWVHVTYKLASKKVNTQRHMRTAKMLLKSQQFVPAAAGAADESERSLIASVKGWATKKENYVLCTTKHSKYHVLLYAVVSECGKIIVFLGGAFADGHWILDRILLQLAQSCLTQVHIAHVCQAY